MHAALAGLLLREDGVFRAELGVEGWRLWRTLIFAVPRSSRIEVVAKIFDVTSL